MKRTTTRFTTRRSFLSGCAAAPVLAGIFDRRRANAAPGPAPQRFLIVGHPEGTISKVWRPTGGERDFVLSDVLKPLEPWRSKMIVIDGLHSQTALDQRINPHASSVSGVLTGRAMSVEKPGQHPSLQEAPSASVDQVVADKLRGPARLRTLEVSIGPASVNPPMYNYPIGGGRNLPGITDPPQLFDRLFSGVVGAGSDGVDLKRLRTRRASAMDFVARDLQRLQRALPAEDARKLSLHLDAIRDLEKQITAAAAQTTACAPGARPKSIDNMDKMNIPVAYKVQLDLLIQAFACDITRVATFAPCDTNWNVPTPHLGFPDAAMHSISHSDGANAKQYNWTTDAGPKLMRWNYEQMAYLLKGLDSIPEGDGTVLDHTLVLSIAEFGDSGGHSCRNLPIILLGSAGGYLRTGRFVQMNGEPHNDVLTTIVNALGIPAQSFGDPQYCKGPMAVLRA